jgi:hypothetical protein
VSLSVSISGLDSWGAFVAGKLQAAQQAARAAMYQLGEEIMAESKRLVPVDLGTLRSTGIVELPVERGGAVVVVLGYGGPAAPYALVQHEDLSLKHPEGGQAKYLEQPFLALAPTLTDRVAAAVRKAVES